MKAIKIVEIEVPENIEVNLDGRTLAVKGTEGEVKKTLGYPLIGIEIKDKKIILEVKKNKTSKREKRMLGTFKSHIKNMFEGVEKAHVFKLKICSGHFPMTASVEKESFVIKNFFGESVPRTMQIKPGVEVKIDGDIIVVTSIDKELAGQTAASIEKLTKIKKRDLRIFQDGCYIIEKSGKEL